MSCANYVSYTSLFQDGKNIKFYQICILVSWTLGDTGPAGSWQIAIGLIVLAHFWFGWQIIICFLAATKQLYEWFSPSVRLSVCPSVCLSVRPSVCLSHLFDYVPIILSSWNFQELLPVTKVTSMQKVKVRGQRSRSQRSRPKFSFPDCNSSLNSHMMMKWYI